MSPSDSGSRSWTIEQSEVLSSSGQGLAVSAGAGAGKTTTLVEKCVRLLRSHPEARICAVSFTERSASDLRAKLSKAFRETAEFDLSRHWITTIHGLCGSILREFPRESGYQGDERVLSELESQRIWQKALQSLWMEGFKEDSAVDQPLQRLLAREGKSGTEALLMRFRELEATGISERAMKSEDPDLSAAGHVAVRVLGRYQKLKARSSGIDFSDLEKAALSALGQDNVRKILRERFDLVLVDEFQDTNPTQAQIIWSMIRTDQSNLCVVGDPKQSIYRFRDADVGLFEESCARLPVRKSLTTNFRSHPRILEVVNQMCAPLFESSSLSYEPLSSGRDSSDFGLGAEESPAFRLNVESPEDLAEWISTERSRGVPLDSMAILMRRVRGMEAWIQALSRRGIPVAVGGGGLFWQDPRVLELLSLVTWWAYPVDEWSALGFLTAPWMEIPTAQLDAWKRADGNFEAFWKSDHPVAKRLRSLRLRDIRPSEVLSSLLEDPQFDGCASELAQSLLALWYRCEQLSLQGCDFQEVVRRLNETVRNGKREKEVPPPTNRGVLPILTIHASKGLEFDYVFLIDFGKKQSLSSSPLLFVDRRRGVFLTPRTPDGKRNDRDELYKEWKNFEQSAAVAESKRQFYVALTRAKKRLVFVCSPIDPDKGFLADREKALTVDHWRGWLEHLGHGIPVVLPRADQGEVFQGSSSQGDSPGFWVRQASAKMLQAQSWARARHSVSDWTILGRCERSYAHRLSVQWAGESESADERFDETLRDEPSEGAGEVRKIKADELGKSVHALLEKWLLRDQGVISSEFRRELDHFGEQVGASAFNAAAVLDWLAGSGRLAQKGHAELPFEWVVDGVPLVGVLDRVEELAPGHWRVMDYKVIRHRKSDDELIALYSPQIEIYAAALRRVLKDSANQISALLVQITPEGVYETPIPVNMELVTSRVSALAGRARHLVEQVGLKELPSLDQISAKVGPYCRHCSYRPQCDTQTNAKSDF